MATKKAKSRPRRHEPWVDNYTTIRVRTATHQQIRLMAEELGMPMMEFVGRLVSLAIGKYGVHPTTLQRVGPKPKGFLGADLFAEDKGGAGET